MNKQFTIKPMTIEDYDGLHALWMTIHGFGIRASMIPEKVWNVLSTGIPAPVW